MQLANLKAMLPEQLNPAQIAFLQKRTPPVFIKYRQGRGGNSFAYVEVGYVQEQLNAIFGFGAWDWEYEIVSQLSYPGTPQMVVTGVLTVRVFDRQTGTVRATIRKTASGGGDIKLWGDRSPAGLSGKPIDLADDVKSASADALKKAASMIGIAADIYSPHVYAAIESIKQRSSPQQVQQKATLDEDSVDAEAEAKVGSVEDVAETEERKYLLRSVFAAAKELSDAGKLTLLGLSDEKKKEAVRGFLAVAGVKVDSFATAPLPLLRSALEKINQAKGQ